MVYYRENFVME